VLSRLPTGSLVFLDANIFLLTTDAVIIATMRRHRISHLISNDRDFLRIPGITLWRP
jgi:predicted nucleic acid-binding protein